MKAEYAAQSGVARVLATWNGRGERSIQLFTFDDGSEAQVETKPWGVYQIVRSEGGSKKSRSTRIALAALRPTGSFQQALVFGNASHQLVFAGTSSVTGGVVVGSPGVTTGSLRNIRTPPRVPINGSITKEPSPAIPQCQTDQVWLEVALCRSILEGAPSVGLSLSSSPTGILRLEAVPDSIETLRIQGSVTLHGSIVRRERPLRIAVQGRATLGPGTSLRGLVSLYSSRELSASCEAATEHAILTSAVSIELESGSAVHGQVISPIIEIDSGAAAGYPSVLLSFPVDSVGQLQRVQVHSGARVEGLVVLAGTSPSSPRESIVEIEPRALVIGASYSESRTTLDGTVIGSVVTRDFYFYHAPTQYLGWIRNGVIDRSALPSGFLVPALFPQSTQVDVMDWL